MEFRLFYRGPLKANGDKEHKHDIRRRFHPQLKNLWGQSPLRDVFPVSLSQDPQSFRTSLQTLGIQEPYREVGACKFFPLVRKDFFLIAQLEIILLRPEEPGAIITQSGDIDNRLKTLFDALRMPKETTELPAGYTPTGDELPIFCCLLEDDALITSVSVLTDRLLEPVDRANEVILLIHTRLKATKQTWTNQTIIG